MNKFIAEKMITGNVNRNYLLNRLIKFHLNHILPIIYNHIDSEEEIDKVTKIETKFVILQEYNS